MAAKPKAGRGEAAARNLTLYGKEGEDEATVKARSFLHPSVQNGVTIGTVLEKAYAQEFDLGSLIAELSKQCALVSKGDLALPDAMLTAQLHSLDALFNHLMQWAYRNLNDFDAAERLLRLALRTQSQSRATVETLGNLKNPPIVFAKQANLTSGPQQINNDLPRARESTTFGRNKLLGQSDGKRLDAITSGGAVSSDPPVATVGTFNRTTHG